MAKDLKQAKMLHHFQCPEDGISETIKARLSFNFAWIPYYSYDLYKFSEEEILCMRLKAVQKVKIKRKRKYDCPYFLWFLHHGLRSN